MKIFSFILLLAALIQTSFLPIDLCLILLICRSYAVHSRENYYLAVMSGILMGILSSSNLGFWPLLYVLAVLIVHIIRLLPITRRSLTVIPVTFLILTATAFTMNLFLKMPFIWWYALIGSLIALPIYMVIRIWEDRFITKPGIKLRV
jgi:hypothetical protein